MLERKMVYGFEKVGNLTLEEIRRKCAQDVRKEIEKMSGEFPSSNILDEYYKLGEEISYNTKNIEYSNNVQLLKEGASICIEIVRIGNHDYFFYTLLMIPIFRKEE